MKFPRKLKKQIKKDIMSRVNVTNEVFCNESFYLSVYNKPLNRVLNSLVYLNCPTRQELIEWWDTGYPNDPATKIAKDQTDLFKNLDTHKRNTIKNYLMAGKTMELTTIILEDDKKKHSTKIR